jgi:phosphatidate cytidylyltransferase
MAGTFVPLPTLDLVASLGGALAVAGAAYRFADRNAVVTAGSSAQRTVAGAVALAGAAGAFWLGGDALTLLFAVVSALALADFLARAAASALPLHAVCCYGCVPLQYALIAAGCLDWALVALPLVAALALPLATLRLEGVTALAERASQRAWAVLAWVYFISHVPLLLLLDGPAFEARNAGLVGFVVAIALATQALWPRVRPRIGEALAGLVAMGILGAVLAWMTPFAPWLAGVLAALCAVAGAAGCRVLGAMRGAAPASALDRLAVRPDALAFAAPVFFHAVRACLAA